MASTLSIADLRNMSLSELRSEIVRQQAAVRKMRISITIGREKNSALYRSERRQLARMETVATAKRKGELSASAKPSTLSAPTATASHSQRKGKISTARKSAKRSPAVS